MSRRARSDGRLCRGLRKTSMTASSVGQATSAAATKSSLAEEALAEEALAAALAEEALAEECFFVLFDDSLAGGVSAYDCRRSLSISPPWLSWRDGVV